MQNRVLLRIFYFDICFLLDKKLYTVNVLSSSSNCKHKWCIACVFLVKRCLDLEILALGSRKINSGNFFLNQNMFENIERTIECSSTDQVTDDLIFPLLGETNETLLCILQTFLNKSFEAFEVSMAGSLDDERRISILWMVRVIDVKFANTIRRELYVGSFFDVVFKHRVLSKLKCCLSLSKLKWKIILLRLANLHQLPCWLCRSWHR